MGESTREVIARSIRIFPDTEASYGLICDPVDAPTMERIAIEYCAGFFRLSLARTGVRSILKELCRAHTPWDCEDIEGAVGFIEFSPDAYCILRDDSDPSYPIFHVWFVEVEDTSKLSVAKLKAYADLWFDFDGSNSWEAHLILTDRYGRGGELDLRNVFYAMLAAGVKS